MSSVYLIRHGESQHNAAYEKGEAFLATDELGSTLTEKGKTQILKVSQTLKTTPFDVFYSSDLHRARQTAEILAKPYSLSVHTTPQLRERHWGSLEGKNFGPVIQELQQRQNGLRDVEKMQIKLVPDMESEWEAAERMDQFLRSLWELHPQQHIGVVSHGNAIRSFLVRIGTAPYEQLGTGTVNNGAVIQLALQANQWQVHKATGVHLLLD